MYYLIRLKSCILFILFSSSLFALDDPGTGFSVSTAYYSLDSCEAYVIAGTVSDYSEFTAIVDNDDNCAEITPLSSVYRQTPYINKHSCTEGVNGNLAMCIDSYEACNYISDHEKALRFNILVTPGANGITQLSNLSFYEQGPEEYTWIDGPNGLNNYPQLYGLRILKNGIEIYRNSENLSSNIWSLQNFEFDSLDLFTISEASVFSFEILPYCLIGNSSSVSAWDIDEILISVTCSTDVLRAGRITFANGDTITNICGTDGDPDYLDIEVSDANSSKSLWVVTDQNNIILTSDSTSNIDFDGLGIETCKLWHIAYEGLITGFSNGQSIFNIQGCIDISNALIINHNGVQAKTINSLTGQNIVNYCLNNQANFRVDVAVSGSQTQNCFWIITDGSGIILDFPVGPPFVFDVSYTSTSFIYSVSYIGSLSGLFINANISQIQGCYALSNSIQVNRQYADGGDISIDGNTVVSYCVNDSNPVLVNPLLNGNIGSGGLWLVTTLSGDILKMSMSLPLDVSSLSQSQCLIWYLSFEGNLSGLMLGANVSDIEGCLDFSNSILVNKTSAEQLVISYQGLTTLTSCNDNSLWNSFVPEISNHSFDSLIWVITNEQDIILFLDANLPLELSSLPPGIYKIYAIGYNDSAHGFSQGDFILEANDECKSVSNALVINKRFVEAGIININGETEISLCTDLQFGTSILISNQGNIDASSNVYLITDLGGQILSIQTGDNINIQNFSGSQCLVYRLSYFDLTVSLVEGMNIDALSGCYDLSNTILINKSLINGGNISTLQGTTEYNVCASAGEMVVFDFLLNGDTGDFSSWIITDSNDRILGLSNFTPIDLTAFGSGAFNIRHLSYSGTVAGINLGESITTITGDCFAFSNKVIITVAFVEGGTISSDLGDNIDLCNSEIASDPINVRLYDNLGMSSVWLLTDTSGMIIKFLSNPPIDLTGVPSGVCQIRHLSFSHNIMGILPGNNINQIQGCFDLSNAITVIKRSDDGGNITSSFGNEIRQCDITYIGIDVAVSGNSGLNNKFIVTDTSGLIIPHFSNDTLVGVNVQYQSIVYVWNVSSEENLDLFIAGANINSIDACFALSDSIVIYNEIIEGGSITSDRGNNIYLCQDMNRVDTILFDINNATGINGSWIITTDNGDILDLSQSNNLLFSTGLADTCFVRHISYNDSLLNLVIGTNISLLQNCYALSNSIRVIKQNVDGGIITSNLGDDISFCLSDSFELITVTLSGSTGNSNQLVITDIAGNILALPNTNVLDISSITVGHCLVWNLAFGNAISGLVVGNNVSQIFGCYDLSNSISIRKNGAEGGIVSTVYGDTISICSGDGIGDLIEFNVNGNIGDSSRWLKTNLTGEILSLLGPSPFNLDNNLTENYLVWSISYIDGFQNLAVGINISELIGCYDFSNSIYVNAIKVQSGILSSSGGDTISICAADGSPDIIDFSVTGSEGENTMLVITDSLGIITSISDSLSIDFDDNIEGVCIVRSISYQNGLSGLSIGESIGDLVGCYAFTNAIYIEKTIKDAGHIREFGTFGICGGDGIDDFFMPELIGGSNNCLSAWIFTNQNRIIQDIQTSLPLNLDFPGIGRRSTSIRRICYDSNISGLKIGNHLDEIVGCFDISNNISFFPGEYEEPKYYSSMLLFDMDDCYADTKDDSNMDYSEFEPMIMNDDSCTTFDLLQNNLYRDNAWVNWHSCTEGYENSAVCVSSMDTCEFITDSELAVRFSVLMMPDYNGMGSLNKLSFYEQAPEEFNWINGADGPNNYPTMYGIRILKNGDEIYRETDIPTNANWTLQEFNFTDSFDFYITEPTVFDFELLAYCLVGNDAMVTAWDLDNIKLNSECSEGLVTPVIRTLDGLEEITVCSSDSIPDYIDIIKLVDGPGSRWYLSNTRGDYVDKFQDSELPIKVEESYPDSIYIFNISWDGYLGIDDHIDKTSGCFEISNPILVIKSDSIGCIDTNNNIEDNDLNNQSFVRDFTISPNPSLDNVSILLEEMPALETKLYIFDQMGQIMYEKKLYDKNTDLDISGLLPGFYHIKIQSGLKSNSRRFIKI